MTPALTTSTLNYWLSQIWTTRLSLTHPMHTHIMACIDCDITSMRHAPRQHAKKEFGRVASCTYEWTQQEFWEFVHHQSSGFFSEHDTVDERRKEITIISSIRAPRQFEKTSEDWVDVYSSNFSVTEQPLHAPRCQIRSQEVAESLASSLMK
jgi:hypothetical protein